MADRISPERRSAIMRAVRAKDTKPEMIVRRIVHGAGYRYRLHPRDLPGKPDLAFRPKRKAIFVHGCFWHQHGCLRGRRPASNVAFWDAKLSRNVERDGEVLETLASAGWSSLVVWECKTKDRDALRERLVGFLSPEQ